MAGMKYSLIEFFRPYLPDFYSLRTLLARLSCVKQSLSALPCCCLQLLMIPLIMSVLYVWAQFNKDTIVTFWFGTRFKVSHILVTGPHTACRQVDGWWLKSSVNLSHELSCVTLSYSWQSGVCCSVCQAHYLPWVILIFNFIIGGS